jgi:GxxExxY protein
MHHEGHEGHEEKHARSCVRGGIVAFDKLSSQVIGCAIAVHRELGPGLLESTYEQCLAYELKNRGLSFELQSPLPVEYKGIRLDCGYRVDLLVEKQIIVELKAVESLNNIHEAQILTYMKLAEIRTGLLINFNVGLLKNGIRRFVL